MNEHAEAAKRALELKPGGSNPDPPHKRQEVQGVDTGSAGQTTDQKLDTIMMMMKKVAVKEDLVQMETKVDEMKVKAEGSMKSAQEAKDGVKRVEVRAAAIQGEVDSMRKEMENSK